ncbi:hypothetical protein O1611_g237 [Lasiodiplodia mahajangana]|uniref:Uncharacterized protein n=1 Tax=Lasiodiplodia mahajangana TaxID=1108764 RepID=A0ACC2K0U5_9PEZI|nr:hypothetical protein O1611_g237 [Lasiodiplodia mahajangana]
MHLRRLLDSFANSPSDPYLLGPVASEPGLGGLGYLTHLAAFLLGPLNWLVVLPPYGYYPLKIESVPWKVVLPKAMDRLKKIIPMLSSIRRATATPSFSLGVLHQGEIVFTHCEGIKDTATDPGSQVDLETAYLLGSLTKAFISASCGILVDEGKLEWEKPISSYIPFRQVNDPIVSERTNLLDALSHSTGLPQIDISWYGAQGESILPPEDLFHVVNHIPLFPDFRAKLHYTNWMYALAGKIIEVQGGRDADSGWGEFLQRRIFGPLEMHRSCSNRQSLVDDNFTEPHTALDNGRPGRLPIPDFSDKTITGASAAVWSTVPDMLKWCKAVLSRLELELGQRSETEDDQRNPLRQMRTILAHRFRVTEDTINENSYALGWARHVIPSSHLGWLSTNGPQHNHILGRDSRPRLLFYHGGQITGYLNSIYLFPETHSAVVVLTNAQGAGDCSDWIAQAVIQELFDLKPELDFVQIAKQTASKQLNQYEDMRKSYEGNRHQGTPEPSHDQLVGVYYNNNIKMTVDVLEDDGRLLLQFNHREVSPLESFIPPLGRF